MRGARRGKEDAIIFGDATHLRPASCPALIPAFALCPFFLQNFTASFVKPCRSMEICLCKPMTAFDLLFVAMTVGLVLSCAVSAVGTIAPLATLALPLVPFFTPFFFRLAMMV